MIGGVVVVLAVQLSVIWVDEIVDADKFVGALGSVGPEPAVKISPLYFPTLPVAVTVLICALLQNKSAQ